MNFVYFCLALPMLLSLSLHFLSSSSTSSLVSLCSFPYWSCFAFSWFIISRKFSDRSLHRSDRIFRPLFSSSNWEISCRPFHRPTENFSAAIFIVLLGIFRSLSSSSNWNFSGGVLIVPLGIFRPLSSSFHWEFSGRSFHLPTEFSRQLFSASHWEFSDRWLHLPIGNI